MNMFKGLRMFLGTWLCSEPVVSCDNDNCDHSGAGGGTGSRDAAKGTVNK